MHNLYVWVVAAFAAGSFFITSHTDWFGHVLTATAAPMATATRVLKLTPQPTSTPPVATKAVSQVASSGSAITFMKNSNVSRKKSNAPVVTTPTPTPTPTPPSTTPTPPSTPVTVPPPVPTTTPPVIQPVIPSPVPTSTPPSVLPPAPKPTQTPTSTIPTSPPASSSLLPNYSFGLAVGNTFPSLSDAKLNAYMDDIASLRIGWLRMDFSWNDIQHNDSATYDWGPIDRVVAAANARHIKILPILLFTPSWARSSSCTAAECAPADPAKFAKFAGEAAKRYAPQGIHNWEIWNEPNMGNYWQPKGNILGYVELLKQAAVAIRAQDPQAFIVTGGTGPAATDGTDYAPLDFIDGLYKNGAKSSFDAIGVHPYTTPQPVSLQEDWNAWLQMGVTKVSVRSIMIANGDSSKTIWETEYGSPTDGPGTAATIGNYGTTNQPTHVSEDLQALIISDAFKNHATQSWAGPLFWYSYRDLGTSTNTHENFFGLERFDGSKKPAYNTLKALLAGN